MANTPVTAPKREGNALAKLTDRERKLLILMACTMSFLLVSLGLYLFKQSQDKTRAEIMQYERALDALQEYGPRYLAKLQEEEQGLKTKEDQKFSPEKLKKNTVRLTSSVASHASAVDIKVDNYDEDQLNLTTAKDGGPIITENQVKVDIRLAEMDKLIKLLDRIEKSNEPIVVKRISLRDIPRDPGKVRANLVISTYVQKDPEG